MALSQSIEERCRAEWSGDRELQRVCAALERAAKAELERMMAEARSPVRPQQRRLLDGWLIMNCMAETSEGYPLALQCARAALAASAERNDLVP